MHANLSGCIFRREYCRDGAMSQSDGSSGFGAEIAGCNGFGGNPVHCNLAQKEQQG